MPGGEVDPKSVQYAAAMKDWSSKSAGRPDKHALRQAGLSRRYAADALAARQIRDQLRQSAARLLSLLPAGLPFTGELFGMLSHLEKSISRLPGAATMASAAASGGGGGDGSADCSGRGPPQLNINLTCRLDAERSMTQWNHCQITGFDKDRRDFLKQGKNLGIAAAGIALGLKPDTVQAFNSNISFKHSDLPPGILIVRDKNLVNIFAELYFSNGSLKFQYDGSKRETDIKWYLLSVGDKLIIQKNTPLTEPAYWFTLNYFNYFYGRKERITIDMINDIKFYKDKIKKENPAMNEWEEGISWYFSNWLYKSKKEPQKVEEHLAKSIILAAGRDDDYKVLINAIEKQDMSYIQGLMSSLEKRSYEDKLIAAWSSFYMTLHEFRKTNSRNKNYNFIRYNIEEPLIEKKITPKIRGPPHYPN